MLSKLVHIHLSFSQGGRITLIHRLKLPKHKLSCSYIVYSRKELTSKIHQNEVNLDQESRVASIDLDRICFNQLTVKIVLELEAFSAIRVQN